MKGLGDGGEENAGKIKCQGMYTGKAPNKISIPKRHSGQLMRTHVSPQEARLTKRRQYFCLPYTAHKSYRSRPVVHSVLVHRPRMIGEQVKARIEELILRRIAIRIPGGRRSGGIGALVCSAAHTAII